MVSARQSEKFIFVAYLNYLWFIEAVRGDHLGMEMPVTAPRSLSVIAS